MPSTSIDAAGIIVAARALSATAGAVAPMLATRMATLGELTKDTVAIPIMQRHTPVVSGALRDSTTGQVIPTGLAVDILIRQPATSLPNQDGSGGGHSYVGWVIHGRGEIFAPSDGPFSTGKQALRTPWGPRKHVAASKPNLYNTEAVAEMVAPLETLVATEATKLTEEVAALLKP